MQVDSEKNASTILRDSGTRETSRADDTLDSDISFGSILERGEKAFAIIVRGSAGGVIKKPRSDVSLAIINASRRDAR